MRFLNLQTYLEILLFCIFNKTTALKYFKAVLKVLIFYFYAPILQSVYKAATSSFIS